MEDKKSNYGLITAITMIIGIVIGSGIFFKSDEILLATGGNTWLGVLVFSIGAWSIIFGSLTLTELSVRTKKNGGLVGYFEDFVSDKVASAFGWFQTLVYFPTINAVIAWVIGIYTCLLLDINATLETQIFIGLAFMIFFYAVNTFALKYGGYFQNFSTVIKLIPLLGIALVSLFWSPGNIDIPAGVEIVHKSSVGFGWLVALAPIAFSYDGWVVSLSITNEVENPKRNMPLALIIGPLIVLAVYVLYFLGLNKMLGAEYIMSTRNAAVNKVGEMLLGTYGAKILLVFVLISIMGVLNGLILGNLRMPQALASKNMIPGSGKVAIINEKIKLSWSSCVISFIISVVWLFIHYFTQKSGILGTGDVSEIAIVFSYVCYAILYLRVIKLKKDKEIKSVFKGIVFPVFALMGSAIILVGQLIANPFYVSVFIAICISVCIIGYAYYNNSKKQYK